ncbi:MAG: helix-turn-helix transcriptional regulator [Hyphomonadaceae bacterium]|nr:helix-turn-helix transcriptional regulator [Hyphomonadaceae bacterium]
MSEERSAGAVDREIGARVRARRLEIGMSQERLAELLGVTFQQVQKYEKGINRIAASRLYDIAGALEVPVVHFYEGLGGSKKRDGGNAVGKALGEAGAIELLMLYASIKSAKVRRRLIEVVRATVEEG